MATIALIAHDSKKDEMIAFAQKYRDLLSRYHLIATQHTGQLLEQMVGLDVEKLLAGPMGGDTQIAAQVAEGKVRAVIFLVDPLSSQGHDPDIRAVLRVCNVHNVPLATNEATGEAIMAMLHDELTGTRPA